MAAARKEMKDETILSNVLWEKRYQDKIKEQVSTALIQLQGYRDNFIKEVYKCLRISR